MEGFKPCPFCGQDKLALIRDHDTAEIVGIYCLTCKAEVRFPNITMHPNETYGDNQAKWESKWNGRK